MIERSVHWRIVRPDEVAVRELMEALDLPQSVACVLAGRGYTNGADAERFLRKSMDDLISPFELSGIREAVEKIHKVLIAGQTIVIHGDFDADGITSAALLFLFLRDLGAKVIPFLPNRLTDGHGISRRAIELASAKGASVVITCDCGTSSVEEIEELAKLGIDTIVTDHHQPPKELPRSAIVVNPKLSTAHPHQDLSGVGVAFLLIAAVRSHLRDAGFFSDRAPPNLKRYLDIVALGTLADMAPLTEQNRILVSHGLAELTTSTRPGIVAMKASSGIRNSSAIQSDDVGFRLAPRMNAAARLGHADEVLELLVCDDIGRATVLADQLETWNQERKNIQEQMLRLASLKAEEQFNDGKKCLTVFSPEFHPGVAGLVAQKLAEEYALPAFVFSGQGEWLQGSARSRSGVNVVELLERCSTLIDRFGGHKEAGGCRVHRSRFSEFCEAIVREAAQGADAASRDISIDAELSLGQVNSRLYSNLGRLRPFGIGNPEPIFYAKARVVGSPKEVGKNHVRVTLGSSDSGNFSAIGFGMWRDKGRLLKGEVSVAYTLEENEWNGRREMQIRLRDVKCA